MKNQMLYNGSVLKVHKKGKSEKRGIKNCNGWLNQTQTRMTCIKQISLITSIQIGQIPSVMFICMILSNGIVEMMIMLELESQNSLSQNI